MEEQLVFGHSVILQYGEVGGPATTKLARVVSIDPPPLDSDEVETSHMESACSPMTTPPHHQRLAWIAINRAKLPPQLTADDISGAAMEALVWCVERYDPQQGVPFGG